MPSILSSFPIANIPFALIGGIVALCLTGVPLARAVVRGPVDGLRTVLMTALLASLGLPTPVHRAPSRGRHREG